MLKNSLYRIHEISIDESLIEAVIVLNEAHEIFKGHFPSKPVLPGVCVLQITKEILEDSLNKKFRLINADEIKFLRMIVPSADKIVKIQLRYKFDKMQLNISAKVLNQYEIICSKIKAMLMEKAKQNL